ncbi:hypothetical protein ACFWUZ_13515 [Streptomyces sp. NPDC058646]|uniref:hypothetical protein n=1 Tax=Streptomyces sp. NPDC058646 TaxID=3346574 RepID=UPI0036567CD7
MRSVPIAVRAAGVAVALTALSAVTAPLALAGEEDRGSISADPDPAEPGAQVKLRVHGCNGTTGSAKSAVFVSDADLRGRDGGRSPLYGETMISSHASPGRHSVRVTCDGRDGKVHGSIEVSHRRGHHHPDPHRSPVWPVHAGGGGMSAEVAETTRLAAAAKKEHDDGPGLSHTVIGAVLAAAATLAVAGRALTLRRRRSGG